MDKLSIFSSITVGPYLLKNRLVALPIYTGYAHPDGTVSSLMIDHYSAIAKSGVAMVVVANAAVAFDGIASSYNLRVDKDEFLPGLSRLSRSIKKCGALACLQLNHAGRFAKTEQPLLPSPINRMNLTFNMSSLKNFMNFFPLEKRFGLTRHFLKQLKTWRGAMTNEDRKRIIVSFGKAADRAYKAGFDMIELHGAGGYLLCQFLSAFTHRNRLGRAAVFEERIAFPLEVVKEILQRIPKHFPMGFRLTIQEWVPNGINLPEALTFAKRLEGEGAAYLSASVATYHSRFSSEVSKQTVRPAYLREDMAVITREVNIPTIISGKITNPSLANEIIKEGSADIIGLGRPLRADMHWVDKAINQKEKITACIDCKGCIKRIVLDEGFACRRWSKLEQERIAVEHKLLSRNYRSLVVIADRFDLKLFKASLPLLLPLKGNSSMAFPPAVLFLNSNIEDKTFDNDQDDLFRLIKEELNQLGSTDPVVNEVVRVAQDPSDKEVLREIERGNQGLIFVYRNRKQKWCEKLLYKVRGKVIAFIGSNDRKLEIMVPLDLSTTSLLVLMFLRQTYIGKSGVNFHFVHVVTGSKKGAERRWKEVKNIIGLEEAFQLQLIQPNGDIVSQLLKTMREGRYGTVIMGKRGYSGINRWMMGSVSHGIMRGLTDQSLFLVD